MKYEIDIIVPTYGRPDRIERVRENIHQSTYWPHRITFVAEPHDTDTIAALERSHERFILNERTPNYAGAINTAVLATDSPLVFLGADDLNFHESWDLAATRVLEPQFPVIGTNDLGNPYVLAGTHSTHSLVDVSYVYEVGGTLTDGPGVCLPECYAHDWTDTEFIGVAKARVRFRPCLESVVEHLHWVFGKSERDATYDKNARAQAEGEALYVQRKQAWDNLSR